MIPYALLISLVLFGVLFDFVKLSDPIRNSFFVIIIVTLILFSGTRFETGYDWMNYTIFFDIVPNISELLNNPEKFFTFRMEPGYLLLNSLVKFFDGSVNEVFFVSAVFVISIFAVLSKKYSLYPFIAILLYIRYGYMLFNMMFVRQGISISIFFYSLKYLNRPFRYMALNILASMFHYSLLIVLPLYFVLKKHYRNSVLVVFVLISLILSQMPISGMISSVFPVFLSEKMFTYVEGSEQVGNIGVAFVEKIVLFILLLLFRNKLDSKFKSFNMMFNLFVLGIFCYFAFVDVYVFQQRLVVIFQLSTIFVIAQLLSLFPIILRAFCVLLLSIIITYFFMAYVSEIDFIPYKSWLFM